VGEDTWVGCSENLRLSDPILADLYALGIYKIKDAAGLGLADGWIQQWKSAEELHLHSEMAVEWQQFVDNLKHSGIFLSDQEEELKWAKNKATGNFTTKLG
jgi:hypothetical protein